jgi:DNA recombination protein RmuC
MTTALTAILLIAGLGALAVVLRGLLDQRLTGMADKLDRRLGELDTRVDRRLEGLDGRLLTTQQNAGQTATQIVDRLSKLDGTATQMLDRARDLARLEQALRPPKSRGGFGELLLGNLLRDRLPADSYQLQYTFRDGERVDAVIKVEKLVPVDAKFPLDNFERLVEAEDDERALHERAFARDLKGHVDAISQKYIRPAENTFDFALMYLPSESVYYELVCGKTGELLKYAHAKRVFPVSPTTFTSQLQVIVLGLKGLQIEKHAQDVMAYVAQLANDFERFRGDFDVIGTHLGNAQKKYAEADKRLERFETNLERAADWEEIESVEPASAHELPRAVDAA